MRACAFLEGVASYSLHVTPACFFSFQSRVQNSLIDPRWLHKEKHVQILYSNIVVVFFFYWSHSSHYKPTVSDLHLAGYSYTYVSICGRLGTRSLEIGTTKPQHSQGKKCGSPLAPKMDINCSRSRGKN